MGKEMGWLAQDMSTHELLKMNLVVYLRRLYKPFTSFIVLSRRFPSYLGLNVTLPFFVIRFSLLLRQSWVGGAATPNKA